MAFRFALIAALCVTQGFAQDFAQNPAVESIQLFGKVLEVMGDMGEFGEVGEIISNMYGYIEDNNPQMVVECLAGQLRNFTELAEKIYGMIRNASDEMQIMMGDKYQKFSKEIEVPLNRIASATEALPFRISEIIREKEDLSKVLEAMKEYRNIVEESFKIADKVLAEIAKEVPPAVVPAEEMAAQIGKAARNGWKSIAEAFEQCIAEGEYKPHEEGKTVTVTPNTTV